MVVGRVGAHGSVLAELRLVRAHARILHRGMGVILVLAQRTKLKRALTRALRAAVAVLAVVHRLVILVVMWVLESDQA